MAPCCWLVCGTSVARRCVLGLSDSSDDGADLLDDLERERVRLKVRDNSDGVRANVRDGVRVNDAGEEEREGIGEGVSDDLRDGVRESEND